MCLRVQLLLLSSITVVGQLIKRHDCYSMYVTFKAVGSEYTQLSIDFPAL